MLKTVQESTGHFQVFGLSATTTSSMLPIQQLNLLIGPDLTTCCQEAREQLSHIYDLYGIFPLIKARIANKNSIQKANVHIIKMYLQS